MIGMYWTQIEILIHVSLAMLLGAAIGLERETKDKPAGLRTHMLVAGASTLITVLGSLVVAVLNRELGSQIVDSDPLRILGAVVTGVSFLGAGTILRRDSTDQVEGLTTAASLLLAAAIGMCVALQQWVLAIGVTFIVLITLRGMTLLQKWLEQRRKREE
jgi:putative Mg2+ transporter-C (MgtC) family protein